MAEQGCGDGGLMNLRIGTRASALARKQSERVAKLLVDFHGPELDVEMVLIRTRGDQLQKENPEISGLEKGLFTSELEDALKRREIDLAVHSCKDLPTTIGDGCIIAAVPTRESPYDVLITKGNDEPKPSSHVLTGSPRRKAQWLKLYPNTTVSPIRGNVDTRLRKLRENEGWYGILLAEAGINRLQPNVEGLVIRKLNIEEMTPAPGQGALALECHRDNTATMELLRCIDDRKSRYCVEAERAFLQAMGGGCLAALGALAEIQEHDQLTLQGVSFMGGEMKRGSISGKDTDAEKLGRELAGRLGGSL